jgi:endonuclease I
MDLHSPNRTFGLPTIALFGSVALFGAGFSTAASAQANYYNSVDDSNSAALRSSLHALIDDHTRFPYTSSGTDTWDILEDADQDPNNASKVLDIYRNRSYAKQGGGNSNYNREHSWPNSYGFPDDGWDNYPYTDCHQLFICAIDYNDSRGSKAFRDCGGGPSCVEFSTDFNNGVGGGSGVYPGNSNWAEGNGAYGGWEVWKDRKGDLARAMFYMDVRYEGGSHGGTGASEPNLILTDVTSLIAGSATGNNESVAYMGMLSVLLQWHQQDPPDAIEIARNDAVFSYQGNRNPFVDHPEWVRCLYSNQCDSILLTASGSTVNLTTGGSIDLNISASSLYANQLFQVLGSTDGTTPGFTYTSVDIPLNPGGVYFWDTVNQTTPYLLGGAGTLDASGNATASFTLPTGLPAWLDGWVVSHAFVVLDLTGNSVIAASNSVDVLLESSSGGTGQLVINEVDYDQPGLDTDEFIEIYNSGSTAVDLSTVVLELWNGSGTALYDTINLSSAGSSLAAGKYLVVGTSTVVNNLPGGVLSVTFGAADNNVQNGGSNGDAILLRDGTTTLDSMSYEALVNGLTEGSNHAGEESDDDSLSRVPNGIDTNQNGNDFAKQAPTPGVQN